MSARIWDYWVFSSCFMNVVSHTLCTETDLTSWTPSKYSSFCCLFFGIYQIIVPKYCHSWRHLDHILRKALGFPKCSFLQVVERKKKKKFYVTMFPAHWCFRPSNFQRLVSSKSWFCTLFICISFLISFCYPSHP